MGRRVQKTVYAYGSGAWQVQKEILFVYDGWNVVKEITREGGSDTSRYFVWGLDLSQSVQGAGGVGGLLSMVDGTDTYHYCFDANGNVGQLISAANGEVAAHYEFDPFGNAVQQSGNIADGNPFRFSTKYQDSESNLYYYGYRYYSAEIGRWINRDPIEEEGGVNLYEFVVNSPISYIDPNGHETLIDDKGVVICDPIDQNDTGIYQFGFGGCGPPAPIGETYFWDTFKKDDKIFINVDKTEDFFKLAKSTEWKPDTLVGLQSRLGKMYDVKNKWGYKPTDGVLLDGKYATVRDVGNALAGLNARIGKTSYERFQRIAGALHQGEGLSGLIKAYFGKEYGPPPTYGEEMLQYRMSKVGYNELYSSYKSWKSKK